MPSKSDELLVVVRAPNQEMNDFRVECPSTWSVLQLKEHLQQTYHGNPVPSDQKLIYSGQLLEDKAILKEILRLDTAALPSQHIVHLVCRPPNVNPELRRNTSTSSTQNVTASQQRTTTTTTTQFNPPTASSDDTENTLRYRIPTIQYATSANAAAYSAHLLAMQNMYAQYYQQLIAYQNAHLPGSVPQVTSYIFDPRQFNVASAQQQSAAAATANNNSLGNNAPLNNNNDNNNNNNNVNNNDEEDAENVRDWLDHLYVGIRVMIFAMIIYFYSSVERFALVTFIGVVIFLYQQGRLGFQAQENLAGQVDQRLNVDVAQDRDGVERLQAAMDGEDPRPAVQPDATSESVLPRSPLVVAVDFLKAFVFSLIPETPN